MLYSGMMMGLLAAPMQLLGPSTPAHASAIGDFLRSRQRADGGGKLIAPLKVAEKRLQNAQKLLKAASASSSPSTALNAVLQEVRNASLNCYIFEVEDADSLETKTSVMTQQMGISDPCTLR